MRIAAALDRAAEVHDPHARHDDSGFDAHLRRADRHTDDRGAHAKPQPAPGRRAVTSRTGDDAVIDATPTVAKPDAAIAIDSPPDATPAFVAAISRAIAALRGQPTAQATPTIEAIPDEPAPAVAMTPLEQAVHDMLAALPAVRAFEPPPEDEHAEAPVDDEPAAAPATIIAAPTPAAPAPRQAHVVEPPPALRASEMPEMPVAQSHLHLVVGDDAERVVVTVAVRGTEVNVALRAGDDHTAAALARNAGSLDHAMRMRGLDLAGFTAERDPDQPHREPPQREQEDTP